MLIKQAPDILSSQITPENLYWNRRSFIRAASGAALGIAGTATFGGSFGGSAERLDRPQTEPV